MKKILAVFFALFFTAPGLRADDVDIYGTTSVSLEPNVLIIFDTSGSMEKEDVAEHAYDPSATYSGDYSGDAVYRYERTSWGGGYRWNYFCTVSQLNASSSQSCQSIKEELLTVGYSIDSHYCSETRRRLRHGNYLNYCDTGTGEMSRRTDVAKMAIKALINDTDNVRFGLMRFNYRREWKGHEWVHHVNGGRLVAACGTDKAALLDAVDSMPASGGTPLAETLAEAGLYFAGQKSWFNVDEESGLPIDYTSPMEERCQKNYIILMTDGKPTYDDDKKLWNLDYINGEPIGDYDKVPPDSPGGHKLLDDVAKYLAEKDCNPELGAGTSLSRQSITTYTIGFDIDGLDTTLLQDTADNGGGKFYVAKNISTLNEAFRNIISNINEVNTYFVAPVVPVSQLNQSFAGDWSYFAFFKPQMTGRWFGNIKKYERVDGGLRDKFNRNAVTGAGVISNNAHSYWSDSTDGPFVTKGGVGEQLLGQVSDDGSSRNIYTFTNTGGKEDLTSAVNRVADSNTSLVLHNGPGGYVITGAERTKLIEEDVHGRGKSWILGDIIHSEPVVANYTPVTGNQAYIFVGANDGMLHCFDDKSGKEKWAFVPPPHLDRLVYLQQAEHKYYVDGSPTVYNENGSPSILFFGERRGGNRYYALDISSPTVPRWKYQIDPNILGTTADKFLGQSWSRAQICNMAKPSGGIETVFLLGGGYSANQDSMTPAASDDSGRAVFSIHVSDGSLASFNFNGGNPGLGMTNAVVDVNGVSNGAVKYQDGSGESVVSDVVSRIYAGDLKGNVFVFSDDLSITEEAGGDRAVKKSPNGSWFGRKLCSVTSGNGKQQKIFHAPQSAVLCGYEREEVVFFGTGDRAHPDRVDVVNSLYAVKNNWIDGGITRSALKNITNGFTGTADEKKEQIAEVGAAQGWYIDLADAGEKVYSRPIVVGNMVIFTTYTPSDTQAAGSDPCEGTAVEGKTRLYTLRACYRNSEDISGPYISVIELDVPPVAPGVIVDKNGKITVSMGPVELDVPTPPLDMYFWRRF